jgi:hypothetical protein
MGIQFFIFGILSLIGILLEILRSVGWEPDRLENLPFNTPLQKLDTLRGMILFSLGLIVMGAILAATGN